MKWKPFVSWGATRPLWRQRWNSCRSSASRCYAASATAHPRRQTAMPLAPLRRVSAERHCSGRHRQRACGPGARSRFGGWEVDCADAGSQFSFGISGNVAGQGRRQRQITAAGAGWSTERVCSARPPLCGRDRTSNLVLHAFCTGWRGLDCGQGQQSWPARASFEACAPLGGRSIPQFDHVFPDGCRQRGRTRRQEILEKEEKTRGGGNRSPGAVVR